MGKLKCWKKAYSNKIATNWVKKGKYTNETLRPMVDVRLIRKGEGFRLETYDISPDRKYRENYDTKKQGVRKAIQIMKKHDKC